MRASSMLIRCPHCEAQAKVRTSQQETKTMRFLTCQCTNVYCGHTFMATLEAIRTISPSAIPDADVILPSSGYAHALQEKGLLAGYKKQIKKKRTPAGECIEDAVTDVPFTEVNETT